MGDKMDYTVAVDARGVVDSEIFMRTGARGIPHAVLVGADGKVLYSDHPMQPAFEAAVEKALRDAAAAAKPPPKTYAPVTEGFEDLMAKHSVKELKAILAERGIDSRDCIEKGDLARRIVERCAHAVTVNAA